MDPKDIALVLWGEDCDEVLCIDWVSHLRQKGQRVYLVRASGRRVRGRFGVGLVMDIGLDEALEMVRWVGRVILPCDGETVARMGRDPRFEALLSQASQTSTRFLVHPGAVKAIRQIIPQGEIVASFGPENE